MGFCEIQRARGSRRLLAWVACVVGLVWGVAGSAVGGGLKIAVLDQGGQPLPCRIHLRDKAGEPQRAAGLPFFRDHFSCAGSVELELDAGG